MEPQESEPLWKKVATNLLRNRDSDVYYARVKSNGKDLWRSLETTDPKVAKNKLPDAVKRMRAEANSAAQREPLMTREDERSVQRFINLYLEETKSNPDLKESSRHRREIAVKALVKTWPELPRLNVRRVTEDACKKWAAKARREGTGFVAPKAKTVRKGMSGSAFNKCVEALREIFRLACEHGAAYSNPALAVARAPLKKKVFDLPTETQFAEIVKSVETAGARQSRDCADLIQFLAYSGARISEARASRWCHLNNEKQTIWLMGTKTDTSQRNIPLFPRLAALLKSIESRRGEQPTTAPILRVKECQGALDTACAKVGVKRMTHHDLRHLFATQAIQRRVAVPIIAKWLGHSDGGTLVMNTYGHPQDDYVNSEAAKMA